MILKHKRKFDETGRLKLTLKTDPVKNTLKRRYYNPDTGEVIGQVNRKDIFIPQLS